MTASPNAAWGDAVRGLRMLVKIILSVVALFIALACALLLWIEIDSRLGPAAEIAIPLEIGGAVAHVQVWGGLGHGGRYELLIETPHGRLRRVLWENWGPATNVNLYLTPEGWIATLGDGGGPAAIALFEDKAPIEVSDAEIWTSRSEAWRYLGVAVFVGSGVMELHTPDESPECVPLFGVGHGPHRAAHQTEGSCTHSSR